jgi:hypothetical protein
LNANLLIKMEKSFFFKDYIILIYLNSDTTTTAIVRGVYHSTILITFNPPHKPSKSSRNLHAIKYKRSRVIKSGIIYITN